MKEIDLSKKQSDAWHHLERNGVHRIMYGGAAGGGKSFLACAWQIYRRITYPESVGFIGRNELKTIKESTFITFIRVASEYYGYEFGKHYSYNDKYGLITFANGSKIYLKELKHKPSDPEFTDLGSTEFTDGVFEECTEITEKAYDILNSRIRYVSSEKHGWSLTPVSLATCNPSRGWVKDRFISDDEDVPITLKPDERVVIATLDDNPDKEFVRIYEQQLKGLSGYDYARLRFGDWNVKAAPKSPFVTQFDEKRHVWPVCQGPEPVYDHTKEVIISLDFNNDPFAFSFWHHFRDKDGFHLHCFDEKSFVNADIQAAVDYIKLKYPRSIPLCKITGDAMGARRVFGMKDNQTLYQQLKNGLKLRDRQFFVPANPTHKNSRADCNYLLMHYPDFRIHRDRCANLKFDLTYVEVDAEQSIIKKNRQDEKQRADHLDTFRYLVNTFFREWIIRHQKHGK